MIFRNRINLMGDFSHHRKCITPDSRQSVVPKLSR
jgi:hypothetical protein